MACMHKTQGTMERARMIFDFAQSSNSFQRHSNISIMYSPMDATTGTMMGGSGTVDKRGDLRQNLLSVNSHSLSSGNSSDHLPIDVERGTVPTSGVPAGDVDPFFVFKDDLLIKIKKTEDSLSHYVTLVHDTDTVTSAPQIKDSKKQLKRHIKDAESTLEDLNMTVRMVESKREQFVHIINDTELRNRKAFVAASTDRIRIVKERMNSDEIKAKLETDEKRKAKATAAAMQPVKLNPQDEEFVQYNQVRAQALLKQQDETLDELDQAVVRVGRMAETIHDEIGQQNKLLKEVDEDMDDAQQKLGFVMGKLSKMLKTKSKWQICTVVILSLIVVLLLFIIINF